MNKIGKLASHTPSVHLIETIFIALVVFSTSLSQIKIKERIEIKPSDTLQMKPMGSGQSLGVTLPPLNMQDFALYGSGFVGSADDTYDDRIFVPRIGGTMGLSLNQFQGSASGTTQSDYLLVFGPDGNIRNQYFLNDLDSCHLPPVCFWGAYTPLGHLTCYESGETPVCSWNPWIFSPELYEECQDTMYSLYPPYRIFFLVKAWEPLRFRLYTQKGDLVKPNFDSEIGWWSYYAFTNYPDIFTNDILASILEPQYYISGALILRSHEVDTTNGYNIDYATYFGMKWFAMDSSAVGQLPSVEYSDPITLPDSGKYRIILSQAKPNVNGTLTYTDTTSHILFSDIQSHMGDTVIVGPYSAGTTLQVNFNGSQPCTMPFGYDGWNMGFENWIDYDFADVKVRIEYDVQPPDHLELWSTDETVYYGDTVDVDVVPCGIDSLFSPLGDDNSYEFSIELKDSTSKYGQLIYNGQGSTLVEHIPSVDRRGVGAQFAANGIEPDSTVDLTFHLTAIHLGGGIASSVTKVPDQTSNTITKDIKLTVKSNNGKRGTLPQLKSFAKTYRQSEVPLRYSTPNKNLIANNKKLNKPAEKMASKPLDKQSKIKYAMKKVYNKRKIGSPERLSRAGHPIAKVNGKSIAYKSLPQKNIMKLTQTGQGGGGDGYVEMENDWGMGINPPQDILLGQTIYFQAVVDPTHEKRLFIIPLEKVSQRLNPVLPDIKFSVERRKGDKLGVYYDEKIDEDGNDLKPDMIRFIGRYWKEGDANKYSVKLTAKATTLNRIGGMLVEVKKPAKLFDKDIPNNKPYTTTVNIRGKTLNIDELCIKYADSIGISPQVIKCQMYTESNRTGDRFNPSYRYEPWADYKFMTGEFGEDYAEQPFWITEEQPMGEGEEIPLDHQNVMPIYYPKDHLKQGAFALKYWDEIYWDSKNLQVTGSPDLTIQWWLYYMEAEKSSLLFPITPYVFPNNYATNTLKDYIGSQYTDYAQTRKCASYGLIQMLYTTAQVQGYNQGESIESSSAPEELNDETVEMPLYRKFTEKNLQSEFDKEFDQQNSTIPESNWPKGWEQTWIDSFKKYNKRVTYGTDVFNNSKKFYPQAKLGAI